MPTLDRILVISGFLCLVVGLIGAVAPLLPWSLLSILGILLIHRTGTYQIPFMWIIIFVILVILANIIDYYLPIWGTKKYGGTKAGVWWSIIGMIIWFFVIPPFGMILWPFIGAFVWEYLAVGSSWKKALRSARGSFVGFLLTTGLKLLISGWMLVYAIVLIF